MGGTGGTVARLLLIAVLVTVATSRTTARGVEKYASVSVSEDGSVTVITEKGRRMIIPPAADGQIGAIDEAVAPNREAVGWRTTEILDGFGPVPASMVVIHDGKVRRLPQSGFIWRWSFQDDGRRVAFMTGELRMPSTSDYQLWDVVSWKQIASYTVYLNDPDERSFKARPKWVVDLDETSRR